LYEDFYRCAVCFFKPEVYGRNILENSSFIVSTANFDSSLWGRGFVARLSGATAEVLNIWILMCLGQRPFFTGEKGDLCVKFNPLLKAELFTAKAQSINFNGQNITLEKDTFSFKLFSSILVVYHNSTGKDTFSQQVKVEKIEVAASGKKQVFNCDTIPAPFSYAIRDLKVERVDVFFE
jgi:hypothetical protein